MKHLGRILIWTAVSCLVLAAIWHHMANRLRGSTPWCMHFIAKTNTAQVTIYSTSPRYGPVTLICTSLPATLPRMNETVCIETGRETLPLGEITSWDTTSLPGTVTLAYCGHTIEVYGGFLRVDGVSKELVPDMQISLK